MDGTTSADDDIEEPADWNPHVLVPDLEGREAYRLSTAAVSDDTVILGTEAKLGSDQSAGFDGAGEDGFPAERDAERADDTGHRGAAYVFERSNDDEWEQRAELTIPDEAPEDDFGTPVGIDDDLAVVGALFERDAAPGATQSVYVFERGNDGNWERQGKLSPFEDPREANAGRISSLVVDGDTVLFGLPWRHNTAGDRTSSGTAYVFERSDDGWEQQAELQPIDEQSCFGGDVALEGDTALVGNACERTVYVFERSESGEWKTQSELHPTDESVRSTGRYGAGVALANDTALVGRAENVEGPPGSGAAYVFERRDDGGWEQLAELHPDDRGRCVGEEVALSSAGALLKERCYTGPSEDSNVVYRFEPENGRWNRRGVLLPPEGTESFCDSLTLSGGTAVVTDHWREHPDGHGEGVAYVFPV